MIKIELRDVEVTIEFKYLDSLKLNNKRPSKTVLIKERYTNR